MHSRLIITFILLCFLFKGFNQGLQKFRSIEEALSNPSLVYELQLSNITEVLPNLGEMVNLRVVRLINLDENYDLASSIAQLSSMPSIEELYLYGCNHKSLPKEVIQLKNLKLLQLSSSMGYNLEKNLKIVGKLKQLEELKLVGLGIIDLPKSVLLLKNLKIISLGSNDKLNYPQVFKILSKFQNLESLSLEFNSFKTFPNSILLLEDLKILEMEMMFCNINTIDTYVTLSKMKSLSHLDISGNFIGRFLDEIQLLNRLNTLIINGNGIDSIQMENLQLILPETNIINDVPF